MPDIFQRSWDRITLALGANGLTGEGELLLQCYAESHRKYHSIQHLEECLRWFELASTLAERPAEIEAALWFHDAIYDLHGADNEARSADLARLVLVKAGVSCQVVERVVQLVLATQHAHVPVLPDTQLLVDIDLSILGAIPLRFAEYEQQIRDEYAHIPGPVFRFKRRQILASFLERPRLYMTDFFNERLEMQARINLKQAIHA